MIEKQRQVQNWIDNYLPMLAVWVHTQPRTELPFGEFYNRIDMMGSVGLCLSLKSMRLFRERLLLVLDR